jgi:hypothetical protein
MAAGRPRFVAPIHNSLAGAANKIPAPAAREVAAAPVRRPSMPQMKFRMKPTRDAVALSPVPVILGRHTARVANVDFRPERILRRRRPDAALLAHEAGSAHREPWRQRLPRSAIAPGMSAIRGRCGTCAVALRLRE